MREPEGDPDSHLVRLQEAWLNDVKVAMVHSRQDSHAVARSLMETFDRRKARHIAHIVLGMKEGD